MAQQEVQNGGAENVASNDGSSAASFSALKLRLLVEAPKANDAISFYKAAFGAEEVNRTLHPKRKAEQELPLILSAELKLGGFSILVSDFIGDSVEEALKNGGNTISICLETENVSDAIAKAVSAGAVEEGEIMEGEGACCGERVGKVKDPYGFVWLICSPAKKCGDVAEGAA
ncbi:uncharacterized protein At5g48480 [Gastrolobium bilobum]|uniref:uncharacterized protein At5g48480 n=1 Tax=Gastrolobium bilobum TaxID=150636 RepID=UPI002AB0165C|nr:uncharacterized protein At5g48480 [Gastrolobium bilobum]